MMTDSTFDLLELPLSPAHLEVLARAGAVVQERHRTGVRYRLRFRAGGRQIAISLGADPQFAEQVRSALAKHQAPHRAERQFQAAIAAAREIRRRAKERLQAVVEPLGLRWHGRTLRRPRIKTTPLPLVPSAS